MKALIYKSNIVWGINHTQAAAELGKLLDTTINPYHTLGVVRIDMNDDTNIIDVLSEIIDNESMRTIQSIKGYRKINLSPDGAEDFAPIN